MSSYSFIELVVFFAWFDNGVPPIQHLMERFTLWRNQFKLAFMITTFIDKRYGGCNGNWTRKPLPRKQTHYHLAKLVLPFLYVAREELTVNIMVIAYQLKKCCWFFIYQKSRSSRENRRSIYFIKEKERLSWLFER